MDWNEELDARGFLCPLPILKARKKITAMAAGEILKIQVDDPAAVIDIPHYCEESGHKLLEQSEETGTLFFLIQKQK